MTLIVNPSNWPNKRVLEENLNKGIMLHEPSIMSPWTKDSRTFAIGFSDVVTNHPQRTKFARITRTVDGWRVK